MKRKSANSGDEPFVFVTIAAPHTKFEEPFEPLCLTIYSCPSTSVSALERSEVGVVAVVETSEPETEAPAVKS